MFASATIGRTAAAAVDVGFFVLFAALVAREVIAGRNWRNLKVAALVLALALADAAFHVEDAREGFADVSIRAALGLFVMLILLVGGRVTPSFTGNWIGRMGAGKRPVPSGRPDGIVLALSGVALLSWVAAPEGVWTSALALAAGAGNLWRLSRWRGLAARRDPLVLVLHAGFLLAALGFVAVGASALWPARIPYAASVHVWAVGAVGTMTLAMMTRAILGHTGRVLVASRTTVFAYLCVAVALAARLAMAFVPDAAMPLMDLAATVWVIGFAAFLLAYGPMLIRRSGPG